MRNRLAIYVLALMLVGVAIFTGSYNASQQQQQFMLESASSQDCILMNEEEIKHLKEVGKEALESAFKDQIEKLFSTWMKDDTGQPERARNGVRQAIKAYLSARRNLEAWLQSSCF